MMTMFLMIHRICSAKTAEAAPLLVRIEFGDATRQTGVHPSHCHHCLSLQLNFVLEDIEVTDKPKFTMFRAVVDEPLFAQATWLAHGFETDDCNSVEITRVHDRTVTCDDDYPG
jgi:hypothetical protein